MGEECSETRAVDPVCLLIIHGMVSQGRRQGLISMVEGSPRMINCFSARLLPRETSSSIDSHIPFESLTVLLGFRLLVEPL